jgi:hypothetical protein
MERKVSLEANNNTVWPVTAGVAMTVLPFGIHTTTTLRFVNLPSNMDVWTFHMPIAVNARVQHVAMYGALRFGDVKMREKSVRCQRLSELTWDKIKVIDPTFGLSLIIVTAQPVSFKSLFMDHLHLGSPDHPCHVRVTLNLSSLIPVQQKAAAVSISGMVKGIAHNMFYFTPIMLEQNMYKIVVDDLVLSNLQNARISVHLNHNVACFQVPELMHAFDNGVYYCISPVSFVNSRTWVLKSLTEQFVYMHVGVSQKPMGVLCEHNTTLASVARIMLQHQSVLPAPVDLTYMLSQEELFAHVLQPLAEFAVQAFVVNDNNHVAFGDLCVHATSGFPLTEVVDSVLRVLDL